MGLTDEAHVTVEGMTNVDVATVALDLVFVLGRGHHALVVDPAVALRAGGHDENRCVALVAFARRDA